MIHIENVSKSFGDRRVLIDYNVEVKDGESFVIMGPSGCGKSVTLKHVVGLLKPDAGTITVDGKDVTTARGEELREIRESMGFLFQGGALLNWMTVGENLALPLREDRRQRRSAEEIERTVKEKLALVNMSSESGKYPDAISGGMRKRASLARALVKNPKTILYDEPTSGLDPRMSSTIANLIRNVQQQFGVTSIAVTHDLRFAYDVADRIGVMHLGRLIEIGTPDQIRDTRNQTVRDFIDGRPILTVDEETNLGLSNPGRRRR